VLENRVQRGIFKPKGEEATGAGKDSMRSYIICTLHQIILG
jgi:hypothetical protein